MQTFFSGGNPLLAQNHYAVNVFKEILFDCLRKRRKKLDAHSRSLIAAFLPVPDNEG